MLKIVSYVIIYGLLLSHYLPLSFADDSRGIIDSSVVSAYKRLIDDPNQKNFFNLLLLAYTVDVNIDDILFLKNRLSKNSVNFLRLEAGTEFEFGCTEAEVAISCLEAHVPVGSEVTEIKGIASRWVKDSPFRIHIYSLTHQQSEMYASFVDMWIAGFIAGKDPRAAWEKPEHPAILAWNALRMLPTCRNLRRLFGLFQNEYPDWETVDFMTRKCFCEENAENDGFIVKTSQGVCDSRAVAWRCLQLCMKVVRRDIPSMRFSVSTVYDRVFENAPSPSEAGHGEDVRQYLQIWMKGYGESLERKVSGQE